jgi:hypothetical protein
MSTQVCILSDGRRIKFSIKRRKRDPFYLVKFRGPDGRPRERSTKEAGQRRAVESAIRIIQEEYEPEVVTAQITWEEAIEKLKEGLEGKNLRWATVHDYCCTVHTLRDMFRKAVGPGEITPEMAERYKIKRLKQGHSASTVESNLRRKVRQTTPGCCSCSSSPFSIRVSAFALLEVAEWRLRLQGGASCPTRRTGFPPAQIARGDQVSESVGPFAENGSPAGADDRHADPEGSCGASGQGGDA